MVPRFHSGAVEVLNLYKWYINNLFSKAKLFADNRSLFNVEHDINTSANELNSALKKVSIWAFQSKMIFNLDPSKQAQDVPFSCKLKEVLHPSLIFNNANFSQCKSQKQPGIIWDSRLIFEKHYKTVLSKANRTIGLLRKHQSLLPREALIIIYKAFVRPHLDYGDVFFDQAFNASLNEKLESI